METDKFFTKIAIEKSVWSITHNDSILLMGSCFTDEIGEKFIQHGFNVAKNPFGTIYNPCSIANLIIRAVRNELFSTQNIIKSGEYYYLFEAHGDIRGKEKEDCLTLANRIINDIHNYLGDVTTIIITIGTALSYWYKQGNILMANCHKIPQKMIDRRFLTMEQIIFSLNEMMDSVCATFNKDMKFIFTVSPVRHIKEGYYDNKISKAILHLAIDKLLYNGRNVKYFPSYEIMMDELRDYRFYAKDLVHINEMAVDYIWQRFSQTYFSEQTILKSDKYFKLFQMKNHRPFNPDSDGYKQHLRKIERLEKELMQIVKPIN